jgi:hypothetical protein
MSGARALAVVLVLGVVAACTPAATAPLPDPPTGPQTGPSIEYYKKWSNGPNPVGDPNHFPITVWMQDPSGLENGANGPLVGKAYQEIGIPVSLGLWDDEWWYRRQKALYQTGWTAYVSPAKVDTVLADPAHAKNFVGYLVADEPDMQKALGDVFHPEFQPSAVLKQANDVRAKDPTRPTYINFGVWMGTPDGGVGYGYIEKSYEEDMRTYCSAADIASADYYGWTHPERDKVGAFSYGQVIDTMRKWCGPDKPLYGFVETGHPHEKGESITPDQLEQAVWNTIVHGATGIDYFAHSFYPEGKGEYASALTRSEISARLKQVNAKLRSLAPVLTGRNHPGVSVTSTNGIAVSLLHKVVEGKHYVVSQADGNTEHPGSGATKAEITVPVRSGTATVVDENRTVSIADGRIVDDFSPYQVHVYRFG